MKKPPKPSRIYIYLQNLTCRLRCDENHICTNAVRCWCRVWRVAVACGVWRGQKSAYEKSDYPIAKSARGSFLSHRPLARSPPRYHAVRLQSVRIPEDGADSDVGSAEARKTKICVPEGQQCLSAKSPLILGKRHRLYHYLVLILTLLDRHLGTPGQHTVRTWAAYA